MKKWILGSLSLVCLSLWFLPLSSNTSKVNVERDTTQVFMMNTISILKEVSENYRNSHSNYSIELKRILKEMHGLSNQWSSRDTKGRQVKRKLSDEELTQRTEKLIDEALDKSLVHLADLQKIIVKERKKIRDYLTKGIEEAQEN